MAVVSAVLAGDENGHQPMSSAPSFSPVTDEKTSGLPVPYQLKSHFTTVTGRPWLNQKEAIHAVNRMFKYILTVSAKEPQFFNTPYDQKVLDLVRQYENNTREFRYALVPLDDPPSYFGAMYDARRDLYFVGNHYFSLPEISLVMYHEITHEVDVNAFVASGISRENADFWDSHRCVLEEHAHAATMRFILALDKLSLLPAEIQGDPGWQNHVEVDLESWGAIVDGTFCAWLDDLYRNNH
jgi:hypothetical protein